MENGSIRTKVLIGCFAVSTLFILLFSAYTTVLNDYYGFDSAVFCVMGKGLLSGKIPYVDLFDHKGPMLYFVWALGLLIGNGTKWGVFFLQCLSLTISLYYIYKLCVLLKTTNKRCILLILFYLVLLCGVIYEGGLTEEWALPCDLICLYWAISYIKDKLRYSTWIYGFFLGIFFSYVANMRINNAAVIGGVVFFLFFMMIVDKKYKDAVLCALMFVLGFAVIMVPIIIYFYMHDALYDMFYASILYNIVYASGGASKSLKEILLFLGYEGITIVICAIDLFRNRGDKNKRRTGGLLLFCSLIGGAACALGHPFQHYFMIFLPIIIVVICVVVSELTDWKRTILLMLLVIMPYSYQIARNAGKCFLFNFMGYYDEMFEGIRELGDIIPDEEKDSVWSLGITTSKYYAANDILPCYKIWDMPMVLNENDMFRAEIEKMMEENPPKWIFGFDPENFYLDSVEQVLHEKYDVVETKRLGVVDANFRSGSQNTGVILYRRNDENYE